MKEDCVVVFTNSSMWLRNKDICNRSFYFGEITLRPINVFIHHKTEYRN